MAPMTLPLWWDETAQTGYAGQPAAATAPPPLPDSADVVIVGGGFTGLWTAYYLLRDHPGLDVLVLEAEHVGFGASGRNGGWVSALYPVSPDTLAHRHGRASALAMMAALRETVTEVGAVAAAEGIDCGFHQGGMVTLARSTAQAARGRAEAEHGQAWGDGTQWLDAGAARERLAASDVHGATVNPHCARVHPRRLVDGIAAAVRAHGGMIADGSRVTSIAPGAVALERGHRIHARHIVRATEAWTATLPGSRRAIAPVYSLMVATEPLPQQSWDEIGLANREVFADHRHVIIYGQRTVDDRIAFGGRGAPYHFRSRLRPEFDHEAAVFADLRTTLTQMLPQLEGVEFTHAWGGPLGIARDWHPSVGYDQLTGLGWAGGYAGDGVAASNLAGRTLADLVALRHTALTELPWVGHRSRRWEPEPLRWLGINAGLRIGRSADAEEARTGRPARRARVLGALTGH
jgi:glycine/D-amino acid oxidase-like deaminating enzyme